MSIKVCINLFIDIFLILEDKLVIYIDLLIYKK